MKHTFTVPTETSLGVRYEPRTGDLLVGPEGERVLVGHVNERGGVCDDCRSDEAFEKRGRGEKYGWYLNPGWSLLKNVLD